jgi:hypothetical protein
MVRLFHEGFYNFRNFAIYPLFKFRLNYNVIQDTFTGVYRILQFQYIINHEGYFITIIINDNDS